VQRVAATIRVALANLEALLAREYTQAVTRWADMVLVADVHRRGLGLLLAVRDARPDLLIVGMEHAELPGECSHLLGEYPHLKVLGVPVTGTGPVLLYELSERTLRLGAATPDELVEAVRRTLRREDNGSADQRTGTHGRVNEP
jgi:hypothetical protein